MTDTNELRALLPCPFCDSDTVQAHIVTNGVSEVWCVICVRGCNAEGPAAESEAEAIAAWNTRASAERVAALEAALADMATSAVALADACCKVVEYDTTTDDGENVTVLDTEHPIPATKPLAQAVLEKANAARAALESARS